MLRLVRPLQVRHATQAQERFALLIHEEIGVSLPTGHSFQEYAQWLDKYAPIYQEEMREHMLLHELHMAAIDARRDW